RAGRRLRRRRPGAWRGRSGVSRARKQGAGAARYAAPAAFLIAVTIAVLLIRAGLDGGGGGTTSTGRHVTHAATVTAHTVTTKNGKRRFYRVESGDTFGSISAKTGVSIARLQQ